MDPARLGLFGHSQGGWVVLEVGAADPSIAFVITNSGPGVTMARQERFSTRSPHDRRRRPRQAVTDALAHRTLSIALVRAEPTSRRCRRPLGKTVTGGRPRGARARPPLARPRPRQALERLTRPLLAIFGGKDLFTPVEDSIAVFRAARADRPGDLEIVTFSGANHRLQSGEPPALHPAYATTLGDWILRHNS